MLDCYIHPVCVDIPAIGTSTLVTTSVWLRSLNECRIECSAVDSSSSRYCFVCAPRHKYGREQAFCFPSGEHCRVEPCGNTH